MPITTTPSGGPQGEFSTYTPIYSTTLSSASASITLSNIPTTYTDLVLVGTLTGTSALGSACNFTLNGDSSALYSSTCLGGDGASSFSTRITGSTVMQVAYQNIGTGTGPSNFSLNFMNYSNATTYKTMISRYNEPTLGTGSTAAIYRSVAPITSITISINGSKTFSSGSTFTLYGIKAAFTPPKALGGDVITTDGTYWYHAFKTTGAFSLASVSSLTADILVVAGGGGGSQSAGGGGGAGGLLTFTSQSLTSPTYTVTVGGGGAGGTISVATGTNGGDSQFGALTLVKGGGRGGNTTSPYSGATGGSGGGGGGYSASGVGGSPTTSQGYAGGNGAINSAGSGNSAGGGGGGAGGAGTNALSVANFDTGSNGGVGATSALINAMGAATNTGYSTGGNYYFAGGGAAGGYNALNPNGTGGTGGGGYGAGNGAAGAGTVNTGGGGGGGFLGASSYGGSGGSGLIIVRYAV
jgi:hypothetical protein